MILDSLAPLYAELSLAVFAMLLLVYGVLQKGQVARKVSYGALVALITAGMFLYAEPKEHVSLLNGMFIHDGFAVFVKSLILLGTGAAVMLSIKYMYEEGFARFEYAVLMLLAALGMMLMVSAGNLLGLYMGLELQSLSLYVLASIRRDSIKSAEAGMKYFVLGALSSGMLLFGISLIYGFTGSIDFAQIASVVSENGASNLGLTFGMVFVLAALAFKISAVPFHMWTPDVYEGAPTSVTAFFAMVPKLAAVALIIRLLMGPFETLTDQWQQIIWFIAAASILWGGFAGIAQTNMKRMLAYSSIANIGFALIGLVCANDEGVGAALVYMALYMVMTAGAFGVVMYLRRDGLSAERIEDLAGLSQSHRYLAYIMAFFMFSMSGIPPMAGFFGKLVILKAAVASGFYMLAVIGVIGSVVACFYYLRVIKVMFFDGLELSLDKVPSTSRQIVVTICALIVLFFVVKPEPFINMAMQAAQMIS
ncbi:MAG: NADH-quinone oxidoreductase subunit NuoN [Pseudomonadota bacterium]|nr:NADH-quinone oxidoreductase subunit NuoN [Alphaproteobacteria bacterium]MCS5596179.1 NADH-quinone oxidoreductase subunit NuoN [Alphaproteobacteria bacterium]MEC7701252.1 NADH-quinone oxidoreductase subunit NuoN [Pseudomonadota bacterium]MED5424116.1 NADH-quinone oxidoreductase subunit NuoN [Pseudomonadota bacterium]|tara:strand:- start:91905 stop:93341 length:1437 start_codon:yes stop_codon:yes gene_type:complete